MAITGQLRWDEGKLSIQNQGSRTELRYVLQSDDPANDNRDTAALWLMDTNNVPAKLYNLSADKWSIKELITENNDIRMWDAVVEYVQPEARKPKPIQPDETADPTAPQKTRFSVRSSSGRSVRRYYSRECVEELENSNGDWLLGILKDDPGRVLNMKGDDSEEGAAMFTGQGIDVPVGTVEIVVETVRLNEDVQVNGYLVKASELAAKSVVNSVEYYGYPPKSLRLTNFSSSQRASDEGATSDNTEPWDVVYTFEYAPQIQTLLVNYPPGFDTKAFQLLGQDSYVRGWQYVDTVWTNDEQSNLSGTVNVVMPVAKRMAVHDIYEDVDFAAELKI